MWLFSFFWIKFVDMRKFCTPWLSFLASFCLPNAEGVLVGVFFVLTEILVGYSTSIFLNSGCLILSKSEIISLISSSLSKAKILWSSSSYVSWICYWDFLSLTTVSPCSATFYGVAGIFSLKWMANLRRCVAGESCPSAKASFHSPPFAVF